MLDWLWHQSSSLIFWLTLVPEHVCVMLYMCSALARLRLLTVNASLFDWGHDAMASESGMHHYL